MTDTITAGPAHARIRGLIAGLTCVLVFGAGSAVPTGVEGKPATRNPEDLLIVDCLLPGQIRKLGRQATFMSARRPIRTTQADCEIRGGEYVSYDRANYQTALKVWMDQAMSGSAEAQNYVGEIYHKGLGIEPDHGMAAQWYQKAAAQGYKRAKMNLGFLYEQGLGVPQDLTRALDLYREASGITGDELLFASQVEVQMKAKEARISSLESDVAREREASQQLREEVQRLRGELDSRRRALQQSQSDLQGTREQLAQARTAVGADLSGLDAMRRQIEDRQQQLDQDGVQLASQQASSQARVEELEAQLADLKRRESELAARADAADTQQALREIRSQTEQLTGSLAQAQGSVDALRAKLAENQALLETERQAYQAEIAKLQALADERKQEDWELMKLLETQLAAKEAQIRQQRQQIGMLETRVGASTGQALAAAPTLELINPPLTVTRGAPAAMLRGGPGTHELVGKVSAPQGIAAVSVNGRDARLASNGVFRSPVEVPAGGVRVEVSARDSNGAESVLEFMMLLQGGASAPSAVAAGPGDAGGVPRDLKLGRYYAVVIGNNSYQDSGYARLSSAVEDATAVAQVLKRRYGYETRLLLNASRFDILSALNEMRESLGENDNLLLYYAGHGEVDSGQQGYWIPVDGRSAEPATWISNAAISDILNTMKARHVLVVADSCYSGTMTRSAVPIFDAEVMPADTRTAWIRQMVEGRSRTALTSGGVQPVPDVGSGKHSYFARALLNVLENNGRLLEAQRLYREVNSALALAAVDSPVPQNPGYSPIQFAGHETGDFFFVPVASARTGP
ncbi:MAG TPA: caspase family protein [Xanthomonadaceae bacterium]|nr:caspase family protein [Xanthomonadaceae bacterium]